MNKKCNCHTPEPKEEPASPSVQEELHLILLPAELVPDLEAQIVNQLQDLLLAEYQRGVKQSG